MARKVYNGGMTPADRVRRDTQRANHAQQEADGWRARRDAAIVAMHEEGHTLREIGAAAGLSHTAIANILERNAR